MGKTAVFVLTLLDQLDEKPDSVSAIVLTHTRELAFQIKKEFENTFHGTWQCVVGKVDSIKARTLARRSVSKRDT